MDTNLIKCNVYIDEAGDLGINRGTKWFILSAVIVDETEEPGIREKISQIKSRLNLNTIHFRALRNFEQKCFVINELSDSSFCFVNVIIDTSKINFSPSNENSTKSVILYNYTCRLLLERVSWHLRDTNRVGKIILSSRGTSRDNELIDYIRNKLLNYDLNTVSNRFSGILSKPFGSWDLLQLADVCATSMFYAYEINSYGFITPCFAKRLMPHIYRYNNKIDSYGIKYYANEMRISKKDYNGKIICEHQ